MTAFAWAVMASCCWGLAPIFEKLGLSSTRDPIVGVLIRSVGVFVGLLAFPIFVPQLGERLAQMPARTWIFLGLGGLLASIVGQICFYQALKLGDVSRIVPIGASYPVIAFVLAALFLKEPVTAIKGLGVSLIVIGTYLLR